VDSWGAGGRSAGGGGGGAAAHAAGHGAGADGEWLRVGGFIFGALPDAFVIISPGYFY
jgi:hypothetical protein